MSAIWGSMRGRGCGFLLKFINRAKMFACKDIFATTTKVQNPAPWGGTKAKGDEARACPRVLKPFIQWRYFYE